MLHPKPTSCTTRSPEYKRATDDGYIWPVERKKMQSAFCIQERMKDDARNLGRQRGLDSRVTIGDMIALGWTEPQLRHYGPGVIRDLAKEQAPHRRVQAA